MATNDQAGNQELDGVIDVLRRAVESSDLGSIGDVLYPEATWGECAGRDNVLDFLTTAAVAVGPPGNATFETAGDRIIVTFAVDPTLEPMTVAAFVRDGAVTELIDATDRAHALDIRPVGDLTRAAARGWQPDRLAPVFPVADLSAAVDRYRSLGFAVRTYEGDAAYAFATRGAVDLHLREVEALDPVTNTAAVYLYVDDADAVYATWRLAKPGGRHTAPADTAYGVREGAYLDPDGNLIRFGSPAADDT